MPPNKCTHGEHENKPAAPAASTWYSSMYLVLFIIPGTRNVNAWIFSTSYVLQVYTMLCGHDTISHVVGFQFVLGPLPYVGTSRRGTLYLVHRHIVCTAVQDKAYSSYYCCACCIYGLLRHYWQLIAHLVLKSCVIYSSLCDPSFTFVPVFPVKIVEFAQQRWCDRFLSARFLSKTARQKGAKSRTL